MLKKLVFPISFGVFGVVVLCSLGTWQLQRLEWKTAILTNIEQRISADPTELIPPLIQEKDQYRSVVLTGDIQAQEIHVLTSLKNIGPGFLIISPLELPDGKLIMVDRGFVPEKEKNLIRSIGRAKIIGNLLWPNEIDSFIPAPNMQKNIWFGRDLTKMAEYLGTDPILVVVRNMDPVGKPLPQRVGVQLSNNHLNYSITWFSLACVWFGMTSLLVYRIKKSNA